MSIAISTKFMDAFSKLPDSIQKRTIEFLERFEANPESPGFNYETINAAADKKIRSVRVNDTYRIILKREEETGTYLLLWIDHHDEAYDWAASKRCDLNPMTGKIQIYGVEEYPINTPSEVKLIGIFERCSENELLTLGVPKLQVPLVKSIKDYQQFCNCKYLLPDDAVENLEWIANGIPTAEVVAMLSSLPASLKQNSIKSSLDSGVNSEAFAIIDEQEELRNIMNCSLEKWRVFLHPTQRNAVERDYSGPARVLGEAGTGKTVVAMHRAKRLASLVSNNSKVLFTTFTTNLADDIRANLAKICTGDELRKIELTSIDAWIARFLSKNKSLYRLIYGQELDKYWDIAIENSGYDMFNRDFYKEEWATVVASNDAYSLETYVSASRVGRGTKLDRETKLNVWNVFQYFIDKTKNDNVIDIEYATFMCRTILSNQNSECLYENIIVDEGQDLSSNTYLLIRAIAGDEHKNDIFIVGDSHQRIYRRKAILSKCGINIKGRSSHLRVNYRTTEEIRKFAFSVLNNMTFDDLDGSVDTTSKSKSFRSGPTPIVKHFPNQNDEVNYVCTQIQSLVSSGVNAENICIVARRAKILDSYVKGLSSIGYRCYEIKQKKIDDRSLNGVRVATMHRVKGLEFEHVFIVSANEGIIPLESAIDRTDRVSELDTLKSERCLLYVALTRTQKSAYITSYGIQSEIIRSVLE